MMKPMPKLFPYQVIANFGELWCLAETKDVAAGMARHLLKETEHGVHRVKESDVVHAYLVRHHERGYLDFPDQYFYAGSGDEAEKELEATPYVAYQTREEKINTILLT